jgi:RNA polymerase sigma-70 factor (ECF subfamily)
MGAFAPFVRGIVLADAHEVNNQPGVILHDQDGKVLSVMALDILDGRIQTIRAVINPDKLEHLGPVADVGQLRDELRRHPRT